MRTELTLIHGGFYLGRPKGFPQSWIIHPRSFCPHIRSLAQNGKQPIISVDFEAATVGFFAKSAERAHLSARAEMSWDRGRMGGKKIRREQGW